jgi:molybdenum cofactor synthesis domain-containing protein
MRSCAILAIGNEILRGEIIDRNSTTLGARLRDLGFDIVRRASVGDNVEEILAAIDFAAASADVIITTGGLGPTSDDLTRHAISKWIGKDLEFVDSAWQKIVELLNQRGVPVAETNRRQAYFPIGASIWRNAVGTADAFQLSGRQKLLVALPGPPTEIDSIWSDVGEKFFKGLIPEADRLQLRSWHTVGQSESALAGLVESIMDPSVDVAYQSSPPFVHIKLFLNAAQKQSLALAIANLHAALEPFSVYQDGLDHLPRWCEMLGLAPTLLIDRVSEGYAATRLQPFLHKCPVTVVTQPVAATTQTDLTSWQRAAGVSDIYSIDLLTADGSFQISRTANNKTTRQTLTSPLKNPKLQHRNRMIAFELAIKHWLGQTS